MADLAERGYSGVLHTFSENDFAYYRGTMAEIVAVSHDQGLFVHASSWGLGRPFGPRRPALQDRLEDAAVSPANVGQNSD